MTTVPPQNLEAEASALGAILLAGQSAGKVLSGLLADEGLRPEHFYRPSYGQAFRVMVGLYERGEPIDVLTVSAAVEEEARAHVRSLPDTVAAAGNVRHYAKLVVGCARRRQLIDAARKIERGASADDPELVAQGEALLLPARQVSERLTKERRQEDLMNVVESGGGERWPWPFSELNRLFAGGVRRGQLTVLVGHRSHGKSALLQSALETFHDHGARVCLYTNEMSPLEIDLRFVARLSHIPSQRILEGQLRDGEHPRFVKAVERIGEGIELQPCEGWTADDVAHDIRASGWDVVGLDLLNNLAGGKKTEDVDHNVTVVASCSRQARCHIIACNHLNQARSVGHDYPREPVLSDIRQSGQIADLANNVLSVYRFEDVVDEGGREVSTGEPGPRSVLRVLKQRGGPLGMVELSFDGKKTRFLPTFHSEPGTVGVAA